MSMTKKEIIYRFLDISFKLTKVERDLYRGSISYIFNNMDHCCVDLSHTHQRVLLPWTMVHRISKQFSLTLEGSKEYLREYFYDKHGFSQDYHYDFLPF
jgi:hypothetical protein